jgi:hypothetical protein
MLVKVLNDIDIVLHATTLLGLLVQLHHVPLTFSQDGCLNSLGGLGWVVNHAG